MARNLQPSEYGFQTVFPQTFNSNVTASSVTALDTTLTSGAVSRVVEQGHDVVITLPFGEKGSGITGCVSIGTYNPALPVEQGSFYPNNGIVFITDESRAIINNIQTNTNTTGGLKFSATNQENNISVKNYQSNLYQAYANGLDSGSTQTVNFSSPRALKITGVRVDNSKTVMFSGVAGLGGYAVDHILLHSGYGLLFCYGNSNNTASGRAVQLNLISYAATGFTVVSGLYLTDTVNNVASGSVFCTPAIAKDLSYTGGNISRVLVGYQADTGVTSGQICAQLVEISGSTITTGNPVVIRSAVASTTGYTHSISITHHFIGSVNAFVIATKENVLSGQLIAATPSSGVVLSGTFGTPVSVFNATGTNVADTPLCTALNTFTGNTAFGVVLSATGTPGSRPFTTGNLSRQMYTVSGNTITTGVISTGVFSVLDVSGVTGVATSGTFATIQSPAVSGACVNPRISEISSVVTSSGLICHLGYGNTGTGTVFSGSCFINFVHVPYSLTSTGFTQYATITYAQKNTVATVPCRSVTNNIGFNFPGPYPFYLLSGNPFNGAHGSFVEISVPTSFGNALNNTSPQLASSGLGFITLLTTTGFFPSGISSSASGYFGGLFFKGAAISGASQIGTALGADTSFAYRIRSAYTFTTGTSTSMPIMTRSGNNPTGFASGSAVILNTIGNYPNFSGLVFHQGFANTAFLNEMTIPSPTGEQTYTRVIDVFKSPALRNVNASTANTVTGWFSYDYVPESIGVVITTDTGNIFNVSTNNYFTTGQVTVKYAKTEKAKRDLIKNALGQYTIKDNKSIFE